MNLDDMSMDELFALAKSNFAVRTSRISTALDEAELEELVNKTNDERLAMNDFYRHVSWALRDKRRGK